MAKKTSCDKRINSYKPPKTTQFRGKTYKLDREWSGFIAANNRKDELKKKGCNVILVTIKDRRLGGYTPVIYYRSKKK